MDYFKSFSKFLKESVSNTNYKEGVYISLTPTKETNDKIREYQDKYLKDMDINKEIHCTLIYSKKPHQGDIKTSDNTYKCKFKGFSLFGTEKDTLVIELESKELRERNKELVDKYGFICDFDEYKSHCTLSYGCKDINIEKLPDIEFDMYFENETVEDLDDDWSS